MGSLIARETRQQDYSQQTVSTSETQTDIVSHNTISTQTEVSTEHIPPPTSVIF